MRRNRVNEEMFSTIAWRRISHFDDIPQRLAASHLHKIYLFILALNKET